MFDTLMLLLLASHFLLFWFSPNKTIFLRLGAAGKKKYPTFRSRLLRNVFHFYFVRWVGTVVIVFFFFKGPPLLHLGLYKAHHQLDVVNISSLSSGNTSPTRPPPPSLFLGSISCCFGISLKIFFSLYFNSIADWRLELIVMLESSIRVRNNTAPIQQRGQVK